MTLQVCCFSLCLRICTDIKRVTYTKPSLLVNEAYMAANTNCLKLVLNNTADVGILTALPTVISINRPYQPGLVHDRKTWQEILADVIFYVRRRQNMIMIILSNDRYYWQRPVPMRNF